MLKQSWIYIKKLALFAPNKIFFGKINYINLICLLVPFIQKNWKKFFCADRDLRGEVIFKSKMGPNSHFPQFDVSLSLLHCMKSKKKKKKKKLEQTQICHHCHEDQSFTGLIGPFAPNENFLKNNIIFIYLLAPLIVQNSLEHIDSWACIVWACTDPEWPIFTNTRIFY